MLVLEPTRLQRRMASVASGGKPLPASLTSREVNGRSVFCGRRSRGLRSRPHLGCANSAPLLWHGLWEAGHFLNKKPAQSKVNQQNQTKHFSIRHFQHIPTKSLRHPKKYEIFRDNSITQLHRSPNPKNTTDKQNVQQHHKKGRRGHKKSTQHRRNRTRKHPSMQTPTENRTRNIQPEHAYQGKTQNHENRRKTN